MKNCKILTTKKWCSPELICSFSLPAFVEIGPFTFSGDISISVVIRGVVFNSFSSVCKFSAPRNGMIFEWYGCRKSVLITSSSSVDESLKFYFLNGNSDPKNLDSAFFSSAKTNIIRNYATVSPHVNFQKIQHLSSFDFLIEEI